MKSFPQNRPCGAATLAHPLPTLAPKTHSVFFTRFFSSPKTHTVFFFTRFFWKSGIFDIIPSDSNARRRRFFQKKMHVCRKISLLLKNISELQNASKWSHFPQIGPVVQICPTPFPHWPQKHTRFFSLGFFPFPKTHSFFFGKPSEFTRF